MPSIAGEPRLAAAWRGLLVAATLIVAVGCGTSKVSQIEAPARANHSVRTLLVAPADGLSAHDNSMLAYAIGAELAKRGYSVVDTRAATALLAQHNVAPADVLTPPGLTALGDGGIDAVLSVSSTESLRGGITPDKATRGVVVKVTSTRTAGPIGGIAWKNAWGGMQGSAADLIMRKGLTEAVQEIAEALTKQLGSPGR